MNAAIQVVDREHLALMDSPEAWLRTLGRATLIRVPGRDRTRTRAVTALLHGDEPSGTRAVHTWLRSGVEPATDVLFYIGSVEAALAGKVWARRMLPGGRDANRCFFPPWNGEEGARARELLERLEAARPEALIDLHNSSGHSPAYGVGTRADGARLGLTALFADHYMLSDLRLGALIEAADRFVTGVVIECGRALDPVADAVALAGLERFVMADELPFDSPRRAAIAVLHAPVRVKVRPEARLAFGKARSDGADLTLRDDVDRHNLGALAAGTVLGWLGPDAVWPFDARGADGVEISAELFERCEGALRTRCALVPVMMTVSAEAAKNDCLFYAMRRR